jgi:hypothetical protein
MGIRMYYRKYKVYVNINDGNQKYAKDLGIVSKSEIPEDAVWDKHLYSCKSKDNEFTWVLEGNNNYSN